MSFLHFREMIFIRSTGMLFTNKSMKNKIESNPPIGGFTF
jgi:uncharacterized protein YneF (UPF0154 family)